MSVEIILSVIGTGVAIIGVLGSALYWLGRRFGEIRERFELINERFERIDERFRQIDRRFKQIDERFRQIDKRFEQIDERFKQINKRFEGLEGSVRELARRVESLEEGVENGFKRLTDNVIELAYSFKHAQEFMVEMLGYERVLRAEAVTVIKGEISRIYETAVRRISSLGGSNPITMEEIEELGRLIKKDVLTLEEALRMKELAWKFVERFKREVPEVWKIYWYACAWIGIAARMEKEKGGRELK